MAEMTPALRTAILDALMERWRRDTRPKFPISREYIASILDMILPVAEPMIREAALRTAYAHDGIGWDPRKVLAGMISGLQGNSGEPK